MDLGYNFLFDCDFETAQEAAQVLVSIEISNCVSVISLKKNLKKNGYFFVSLFDKRGKSILSNRWGTPNLSMLEGRICKKGVKHYCECRITHMSGTVSALAKFQARNCSFRGFDSSFPHPSTRLWQENTCLKIWATNLQRICLRVEITTPILPYFAKKSMICKFVSHYILEKIYLLLFLSCSLKGRGGGCLFELFTSSIL